MDTILVGKLSARSGDCKTLQELNKRSDDEWKVLYQLVINSNIISIFLG